MIAASAPGRPERLLVAGDGESVLPAGLFSELFRPGDVLVVNDAATLPASLPGVHVPTGAAIELRLAARHALDPRAALGWDVLLFGAGDHRTPTEHRASPPRVAPGDRLRVGPVDVHVHAVLDHPRLVRVTFETSPEGFWALLARHGRPIQYAHVPAPLRLWDVWTAVAGAPVALEPPSAGFVLDWATLEALGRRGVEVAALTHAAGLSSTGDPALDARLPLPEPYSIPPHTALAIRRASSRGGRVVALGTTVSRALESAARAGHGVVRAGPGVATLRLGPSTPLLVTDVLVTGVHERGTSHHALLHAFADEQAIERATARMEREGFRHHEFGDAMWLERRLRAAEAA